MTYDNITLGRAGKDALRKACRNHASWKNWAATVGIEGQPSKNQMLAFAEYANIDVKALVDAANSETPADCVEIHVENSSIENDIEDIDDFDDDDAAETIEAFEDEQSANDDVQTPIDLTSEIDTAVNSVSDFIAGPVLDGLRRDVDAAMRDCYARAFTDGANDAIDNMPTPDPVTTEDGTVIPGRVSKPQARRTGKKTIGSLFGLRGKRASTEASVWNAKDAPKSNPHHVFDVDMTATLVANVERNANVWIGGPRGSGKSTWAHELAARCKRPFVRIGFHRAIEPGELIGGHDMVSGTTYWVDGALTAAIRRAGCVVLLDEPDIAPAHTIAFLQTVIDNRSITIPQTGEAVPFADGVSIIATGNTLGSGDMTGLYSGTTEQNAAFIDRFAIALEVDYLTDDKEAKALAGTLGLDSPDKVMPFVRFANVTRKSMRQGENGDAISFRMLVAWVQNLLDGLDPEKAFAICVQNKTRTPYGLKFKELYNADFRPSEAIQTLTGKKPKPSGAELSKAGQAFEARDSGNDGDDNLLS